MGILWQNTLPSYNDIINTSIDGAFLGEILYRLSSNILDDRTSGVERFFREFATFFIDPKRGFDRLLQGKTWRSSSREVYQKEPLTIGLSAGVRNLNEGTTFWNGKQNMIFNLQLDYGDPFEYIDRKAFDVFKVRGDLNFGVGRKILDNIVGYGLLTGNNIRYGQMEILYGIFQNYDYWDNAEFELATLGFSGGVMTKVNLSTKTNLYTKLHLGIAPLEAKSIVFGPDTSQYRDYNYGNGLEGSFESTLNLGSVLSFTLVDYYYYDHTFKVALTDKVTTLERNVAAPVSDKFINIFKPRLTINLFGNFRLGFEDLIYNADRYANGYSPVHIKQTEQKIYLSFSVEDFYHGNTPDNKDKTN